MGTFDDAWNFLGGAKATSATNSTLKQQEKTTNNTRQTQSQSGNVSSLDAGTQALLRSLLPGLSQGITGNGTSQDVSGIRGISSQLMQRASPDTLDAQISAVTKAAQRNFALGEGQQIAQTQQAIGSVGNSFSQQFAQQGNIDLSTQIGTVIAQMMQQDRVAGDQELSTSLDALVKAGSLNNQNQQAPIQNLLAVIDILKGANVSSQQESVGNINQVGTADINQVSSSFTKKKDSPGLLGTLKQLG